MNSNTNIDMLKSLTHTKSSLCQINKSHSPSHFNNNFVNIKFNINSSRIINSNINDIKMANNNAVANTEINMNESPNISFNKSFNKVSENRQLEGRTLENKNEYMNTFNSIKTLQTLQSDDLNLTSNSNSTSKKTIEKDKKLKPFWNNKSESVMGLADQYIVQDSNIHYVHNDTEYSGILTKENLRKTSPTFPSFINEIDRSIENKHPVRKNTEYNVNNISIKRENDTFYNSMPKIKTLHTKTNSVDIINLSKKNITYNVNNLKTVKINKEFFKKLKNNGIKFNH